MWVSTGINCQVSNDHIMILGRDGARWGNNEKAIKANPNNEYFGHVGGVSLSNERMTTFLCLLRYTKTFFFGRLVLVLSQQTTNRADPSLYKAINYLQNQMVVASNDGTLLSFVSQIPLPRKYLFHLRCFYNQCWM